MQPDQEMGPAMQLCVEFSRREKGRKKSDGKLAQAIRSQRRGNRKSQIKWELQQYPTYPELLENRSSKLMLFFFQQLKANASSPKWKLLKVHSSLFHAVIELCPEDTCRAIFPGND